MMSYSMLVDLTISLLEENKHLKADKEALIAGQETLQKALAERLAEVDDLKKHLATLDLCEKSNDELRSALKKKDDELKAVTKRAAMWHREAELNAAEIIKLQAENERLEKAGIESLYNIKRMELKVAKAEAIKEFAERLVAIYENDERYDRPNAHTLVMTLFRNIDNLVKEMTGE